MRLNNYLMKRLGGLLMGACVLSLVILPRAGAGDWIVSKDVTYRQVDGQTLSLDVYQPKEPGSYPAVVLIHGGGWNEGDKSEWDDLGGRLAEQGFVAFAPNYRLAPPNGTDHSPAPVEDLEAAIAWIEANAATYSADPEALGALGSSAGAHIALMLGTLGDGADRVDAVVSWSGPTAFARLGPGMVRDRVQNYIGCSFAACPAKWRQASPKTHVDAGDAPTMIVNSRAEIVSVAQARILNRALRDAGVDRVLRLLDGDLHATDYNATVWEDTLDFLEAHL